MNLNKAYVRYFADQLDRNKLDEHAKYYDSIDQAKPYHGHWVYEQVISSHLYAR